MQGQQRTILGLVFLTVLLDMMGFSVIFPLFPDMLKYYLELEGPGSSIRQLVGTLDEIAGSEIAVVTLFGGVLGSLYSLMQFVFAPIWGAISDRIGRRPTLLVTLAGTALSYLLWFVSGSFLLLVVARLVGGIMAGNISTASAVVADTCEGPQRAKGMGILGAGIGLGMVLGPAVGGLTTSWNLLDSWPDGARFGVNPFSLCALASFVLASINLLCVFFRFPETLPPARRLAKPSESGRTIDPFGAMRRLNFPGVKQTNMAYFFYFVVFSAMEFSLVFLAVDRLRFTPKDNMWMFVFVGIIIALVQGGIVRRLVPRLGEKRVATLGTALTVPGFLLLGMTDSGSLLYAGLTLLAVGSALVMPCLSALASRYTPPDRQGFALGVFRSLGSLARAIGPILGGFLYWRVASWAPYYLGAGVLILPLLLTMSLPSLPQPNHLPGKSVES